MPWGLLIFLILFVSIPVFRALVFSAFFVFLIIVAVVWGGLYLILRSHQKDSTPVHPRTSDRSQPKSSKPIVDDIEDAEFKENKKST